MRGKYFVIIYKHYLRDNYEPALYKVYDGGAMEKEWKGKTRDDKILTNIDSALQKITFHCED